MYTLHLTVTPVMDLNHLSGAILEHLEDGSVRQVASFSEDWVLPDAWLDEDPCATLLWTVRQWSERTSRDSSR